MNVLPFIHHLEGFAVVALSFTHITRHIDIGQEVHLYLDYAVALTGFAASTFDVETKAPWFVAARACFLSARE